MGHSDDPNPFLGLSFSEEDGNLKFHYEFEITGINVYSFVKGIIPQEIVEQGRSSIMSYVSQKISENAEYWKQRNRSIEMIKSNPVHIQTKYEGITIEGVITETTNSDIYVELNKPLQGRRSIHFGFGSPAIFNSDHTLSKGALEGAKEALRWAYKGALNKPVRDLVDDLNRRLEDQ